MASQDEFTVAVASSKPTEDESVPLALVTGATGYVATHVIQQLLSAGKYRVRATVRDLKNEAKVKPLRELVADAKYPLELVEADLENADSWPAAVQGCIYVHHVASPFPVNIPKNPDDLLGAAVQGTLNVLTACAESNSVKKVIVTGSIAAVSCSGLGHPNRDNHVYTEEDWSPEEGCPPYERSKLLAERATWDFMEKLPDEKKFHLVTILPSFIQGPPLTKSSGTSIDFVKGFLTGATQGTIDMNLPIVDVRDVALAHIVAMEKPETNGNRYILVSESAFNLRDLAELLAEEFNPQGYRISTRRVSKFAAWFWSFFNKELNFFYPWIGKRVELVNKKLTDELGIQPRDVKETLLDTAYGLIEIGLVEKTPQYHGPGGKPKVEPKEEQETSADNPPKETTQETN